MIPNVYDPQSLNRYSFEKNSPYRYTDPTGHCIEDLCIVEGATILAITSPYWMPYAAAYFQSQSISDIKRAANDPTAGNLAWGVVGAWDLATPGIPEGKIAKGMEWLSKPLQDVLRAKDLKAMEKIANIGEDVLGPDALPHHIEMYKKGLSGHKTEVQNAMSGLQKSIDILRKALKYGEYNPALRSEIMKSMNSGTRMLRQAQRIFR
jgi:hypothetical protein